MSNKKKADGSTEVDETATEKLTPESAIAEMTTPGVPIPKGKTNLAALWQKVEPFLLMAGTLFGKRVSAWVQAFADAIDEVIASQNAG